MGHHDPLDAAMGWMLVLLITACVAVGGCLGVYFMGALIGLYPESCLLNSGQPHCIQQGYGNRYSNSLNLKVQAHR